MSNLDAYLTENGIRQADFAATLGVAQATVSRLAKNAMRPSLELAVAIERATGGMIAATSWIPEPATSITTSEDAA